MIDLHYWPTQNGWKITIMLEECGLPYQVLPVNLGKGEQVGQNGHFLLYAQEQAPYAIERFGKEVDRLYGVLDRQLERTRAFVAGDYSIADMAIFPWARTFKKQQVPLERFPQVQRWYDQMKERPAVRRGIDVGRDLRGPRTDAMSDEARKILFGQTAQSVRAAADTTGGNG